MSDHNILLLTRCLDIGGAERQLVLLANGLHRCGIRVQVVTFYPGGALREELLHTGILVTDLGKKSRWDVLSFLRRAVALVRRENPTVLYCFLPVANIIGILVKPFAPRMRVLWGIRAGNMDLSRYDRLWRSVAWLEAKLGRWADLIVCNSQAGRQHHLRCGFPANRMVVVPNGIDTARFCFDLHGRRRLRHEWGVAEHEVLIGLAARLDPMKDHHTFLEAAARLAGRWPKARFVCVGSGPADYRAALVKRTIALGLADRMVWAEARQDMSAVYSACDIASSSSAYGEGFSNTIAEAMSCERICVVTDVGDSALIVGETGRVVPANDPLALAEAWALIMNLEETDRRALGQAARARVIAQFGVDKMVEGTGRLLELW